MAGAFGDGTRSTLADLLRLAKPSEAASPTLKQAAQGLGLSDHVLDTKSQFLSSLEKNPHGWGPSMPSMDPAYDAPVQPGDETWRHGMLPLRTVAGDRGEPERMEFAVPGIAHEFGNALMAPGKAYFEGMSPEEINRSAASAAGFAMTGGLVAPKAAVAGNALNTADHLIARYKNWRHPNEPSILPPGRDPSLQSPDDKRYSDINTRSMKTYGVGYEDLTPEQHRHITYGLKPRPKLQVIDGDLFSNGSREGAGVGMVNALSNDAKPGITAYHGSPHDFDKFSLDKIGSGEGAQAYGHGLYFAENEGVARNYKQKVPYQTLKREFQKELPDDADFADVISLIGTGHFTPYQESVLKALQNDDWLGFDYPSQAISAAYSGRLKNWDPSPALEQAIDSSGRMYQVRINADPNDFLDWDKPLSQQPAAARNVFETDPAFIEPLSSAPDNFMRNAMRDPETSSRLREAGIPGIRYLDQGSRAAGEGSSNYVVFDDALIEILKKYGWLPPAYAAGSGAFGPGNEDN